MMKRILVIMGLVIIGLLVVLSMKPPSEASIAGKYSRTSLGVTETVTLEKGGKLHQVLVYPDQKEWTADGRWEIHGHSVMFTDCLYYYDDEKWKSSVLNPPQKAMGVRYSIGSHSLKRELEIPLDKQHLPSGP